MPLSKNTSLKEAAADLGQVLSSSLSGNQDCLQAIANIEEIINSIEQKLNGQSIEDSNGNGSGEVITFAPEAINRK